MSVTRLRPYLGEIPAGRASFAHGEGTAPHSHRQGQLVYAAAGVFEADVLALFGDRRLVPYPEALDIGRSVRRRGTSMFLLAAARRRASAVS